VLLVSSFQTWVERFAAFLDVDSSALARIGARVVGIWVLAWLALRLIGIVAQRIVRAVDDGDDSVISMREKRGATISQLLRSVGRAVVLVIAGLMTVNVFINIGPILAGAGILGLAVSFGAQSLVKDVIAGFFILVEDQFVVGDVVEAAGKSGVVEKMSLRVVMLRDLEGTLHIVPNGEIKTVSNRTRGWSRAVVDVAVAYNEDVDRAIGVIRDEAEKLQADDEWKVLLDGIPEVWGVEKVEESAVLIRMVARTQPGSHWGVGREFRRRVKNRLDAEGIQNPLQQRQVRVRIVDAAPATDVTQAAAAAGGS
jgi:moderate conductance mechanosensitive channel